MTLPKRHWIYIVPIVYVVNTSLVYSIALPCFEVILFRGYPVAIRTDQGPEFTSKALDQWAYEHGVQLKLIQPGKPTQNA